MIDTIPRGGTTAQRPLLLACGLAWQTPATAQVRSETGIHAWWHGAAIRGNKKRIKARLDALLPADRAQRPALPVRPLRAGLRPALAVFGAAWVGWALLGLLGVGIVPPGQPPVSVPGLAAPPVTPGWHNLLTPGERDDALWYLRIATQGYRADDASPAFFPLYPLAVRTLAALPLVSPLAAATVLAQASALGGLVVLFALTTYEHCLLYTSPSPRD